MFLVKVTTARTEFKLAFPMETYGNKIKTSAVTLSMGRSSQNWPRLWFVCKFCKRAFTEKTSLLSHKKQVHFQQLKEERRIKREQKRQQQLEQIALLELEHDSKSTVKVSVSGTSKASTEIIQSNQLPISPPVCQSIPVPVVSFSSSSVPTVAVTPLQVKHSNRNPALAYVDVTKLSPAEIQIATSKKNQGAKSDFRRHRSNCPRPNFSSPQSGLRLLNFDSRMGKTKCLPPKSKSKSENLPKVPTFPLLRYPVDSSNGFRGRSSNTEDVISPQNPVRDRNRNYQQYQCSKLPQVPKSLPIILRLPVPAPKPIPTSDSNSDSTTVPSGTSSTTTPSNKIKANTNSKIKSTLTEEKLSKNCSTEPMLNCDTKDKDTDTVTKTDEKNYYLEDMQKKLELIAALGMMPKSLFDAQRPGRYYIRKRNSSINYAVAQIQGQNQGQGQSHNQSQIHNHNQGPVQIDTSKNNHEKQANIPQCRKCLTFVITEELEDHEKFCQKYKCKLCKKFYTDAQSLTNHEWTNHEHHNHSLTFAVAMTDKSKHQIVNKDPGQSSTRIKKRLKRSKSANYNNVPGFSKEKKKNSNFKLNFKWNDSSKGSSGDKTSTCENVNGSVNVGVNNPVRLSDPNGEEKPEQSGLLFCDICHKTFTQPYQIKLHNFLKHSAHNKFKCHVCSKSFRSQHDLNYHVVWHKKEIREFEGFVPLRATTQRLSSSTEAGRFL